MTEPIRLATGRYATFDPSMGAGVAISVGRPKFPLGYRIAGEIEELKPYGRLKDLTGDEFEQGYRRRLDRVGLPRLLRRFEEIAQEHGPRLVLLCFEPAGARCHRRTFAEFWTEATGEEVPEWEPAPDPQMMMFDSRPTTRERA